MENEIQSNAIPTPEPAVDTQADASANAGLTPGATDGSNPTQTPANNGGDANKGLNPQPSTDVFEKRFKDMESKYTRTRQQEIAYQKQTEALQRQISDMSKAIQQLTKKPYSPADFVRDLQEKGPEAIFPLVEEKLNALKEEGKKEQQAYVQRIEMLESRDAVNTRRADAENYPDFRKLEDTMKQILDSEDCPADVKNPNMSSGEVLDRLYQLAKAQHSQDAVKAAEKAGYNKATKELAKEASTAVATGGKAAGTAIPDPNKLSTKQLRDLVAQMGGVVDRD